MLEKLKAALRVVVETIRGTDRSGTPTNPSSCCSVSDAWDAVAEMYYAAFGEYPADGRSMVDVLQDIGEHNRDLEARNRCRRIQLQVIHAFVTSSKHGGDLSDAALASEVLTKMGRKHMDLTLVRQSAEEGLEQLRTIHYQLFGDVNYAASATDLTLDITRAIRNNGVEGMPTKEFCDVLARADGLEETMRDLHTALYDSEVPADLDEVVVRVLDGFRQVLTRTIDAEKGSKKAAMRMQRAWELAKEIYALRGGKVTCLTTIDALTAVRNHLLAESVGVAPGRDLLAVARGCHDYGGGYGGDPSAAEVFHHGIQTVINALEGASKGNPADSQVNALEVMGRQVAA